ncbi:MAG: hypothetical protein JRF07_08605, partial [Deltaproteobacteria bacterium]|nr:hypothetical protein [Deltaproteobacteria bacterium]
MAVNGGAGAVIEVVAAPVDTGTGVVGHPTDRLGIGPGRRGDLNLQVLVVGAANRGIRATGDRAVAAVAIGVVGVVVGVQVVVTERAAGRQRSARTVAVAAVDVAGNASCSCGPARCGRAVMADDRRTGWAGPTGGTRLVIEGGVEDHIAAGEVEVAAADDVTAAVGGIAVAGVAFLLLVGVRQRVGRKVLAVRVAARRPGVVTQRVGPAARRMAIGAIQRRSGRPVTAVDHQVTAVGAGPVTSQWPRRDLASQFDVGLGRAIDMVAVQRRAVVAVAAGTPADARPPRTARRGCAGLHQDRHPP